MSSISTWSTTATNNNSASPNGFPEGMEPSGLNNSNREVMAAVRTQHESASWIDLGNTPTRTGDTTFTLVGDQTAQYTVGRRVKCTDSSTLYGTITVSAYTSLTTVTVSLDSGALSASLTAVALGILDEKSGLAEAILAATPNGIIHMWSGSISTIPTGFGLCDGSTYGTTVSPDLTDRFVIHASADTGANYDVGDTGGSATHGHTDTLVAPAHSHAMGTHNHKWYDFIGTASTDRDGAGNSFTYVHRSGVFFYISQGSNGLNRDLYTDSIDPGDTQAASDTTLTGSVTDGSSTPPYYALAYIIKHDG